jgi:hypothetical protein
MAVVDRHNLACSCFLVVCIYSCASSCQRADQHAAGTQFCASFHLEGRKRSSRRDRHRHKLLDERHQNALLCLGTRPTTLRYLLSLVPVNANARGDFLQYESTEQATATRNAIYGLIWPPGNTSKPLTAEFASPKELEEKAQPKAVAEDRVPERGRERERCVLPCPSPPPNVLFSLRIAHPARCPANQ